MPQQSGRRVFLRLVRLLRPYWKEFLISWLCVLAGMIPQVALPLVMQNVVDMVFVQKSVEALQGLIPVLLGLFLVGLLTNFGQGYLLPMVGQKLIAGLRVTIFDHVQSLSHSFFDKRQTGELMSRLMGDVDVVQQSVTRRLIDFVQRLIFLVVAIALLFSIQPVLAALCLLPMPFVVAAVKYLGDLVGKKTTVVRERVASATSLLQEALSGIRVIKSFVLERWVAKRFADANQGVVRATRDVVILGALGGPVVMSLIAASILTAVLQGGSMVIEGELTSGQLVAFILYLVMVIDPLVNVLGIYNEWQQSLATARRVYELLDEQTQVKEAPDAVEMPAIQGLIQFKGVSFCYEPGKPVLENIDLDVRPGETVALVGPSGAGKSTLVNLVPRFYDPTAGAILVDGIDVRTVKIRSLRSQIGIVPQETFLFASSIKENILLGKESATDEEIVEAAKAANADEFIATLKDGYEAQVGERGVSLSMGQRQRIAVARAVLRNPRILILDEATSSLDSASEAAVQEALDRLMKNRTTLVIAHRLSTIRNADRIVVLDHGRIQEIGTHEQLMEKRGLYYELYSAGLKAPAPTAT
ncbi:MAG: ABC transporter ATP-binding protein [Candidatus Bathyarchaeia archaeon]